MTEPNTELPITPASTPEVTVLPDTTKPAPFTAEQQKIFDNAIREAQSRAAKTLREDKERLERENQQLKEVVSGKGSEDQLEVLKGQLAEERLKNQAVLDESVRRQKDLLISQEAAANNHIDVDTTLRLTRNNLRHDAATGSFTVVNDDGTPRVSASGDPMSVSDFFKDFSSKKLHLVRGTVVTGTGQGGSAGSIPPRDPGWQHFVGPNSNSRDANALAQRDPRKYAEYKRQARAAGAIQ
jgi:hypothetical protein